MAIANSFDILQAVIEATPDAIFVKDLEGRYVLVNAAAARFLGRTPTDIIGQDDLTLYPEATARQFIADDQLVLATGEPHAFEGVAASATGRQAYLVTKGVYRDADGRVLGIYGISHDVTELRLANETLAETREALFRAQKMEAVGQLTGGIAHDFNNILAVIVGNLELLRLHVHRSRQAVDPHVEELIDGVLRAALHGRDLTSHLLAFAGRRQLHPQAVDINAIVDGMVRLLGRTLGTTIRILVEPHPDIGVTRVDPAALEAAVLNVALNARDAMPNGGTLTIRTSHARVAESPAAEDPLMPGSYAVLSIEDTGAGMAPDVLARVFEPFFTTKQGSGGTGLGLSMVYGFARQSGGAVRIASSPGQGTTVTMMLPLVACDTDDAVREPEAPDQPLRVRTVLLVEDQVDVRETLSRQLRSLGHRVLVAGSGEQALHILESADAPHVVVTDILLGSGMSGVDLLAPARVLRPDLPFVFISGAQGDSATQERVRASGARLLAKPVTMAQLEQAVLDALNARP